MDEHDPSAPVAEPDTNTEEPSLNRRALLLVAVAVFGALLLVVLALAVFGPARRMPDGRPAPPPRTAPAEKHSFLYEEHLQDDAPAVDAAGAPPEVRGRIAAPAGPDKPPPAAENGSETPRATNLAALGAPGEIEPPKPPSLPPLPAKPSASQKQHGKQTTACGRRNAPPATASPQAPGTAKGEAAIVIDDLGDSPAFVKKLLDLGYPVTLSILPHRPRTREVAVLGRSHGAELLLHQPMEPLGYPKTDPGRGALFTGMPPERVKALVEANLALVPGAAGVNNHMGSKFTRDLPGMEAALAAIRDRGLYFLDSLTIDHSAGRQAALRTGTRFYRRDVFLDTTRTFRAITKQLRLLERIALKKGRAAAIGHPYRQTLEALRWWKKAKSPNVRVVFLGELPPELD